MRTQFDYSVFLSHSQQDKPVVRELANRLKQDGLHVWLDEWEIQPGDMIGLKFSIDWNACDDKRSLFSTLAE